MSEKGEFLGGVHFKISGDHAAVAEVMRRLGSDVLGISMSDDSRIMIGWDGTLRGFSDGPISAQGKARIHAEAKAPKSGSFDLDAAAAKFKAAGADHPSCSGPVTLVKDKCERYATVTGLSTGDVLVDWPMGVHHLFPCDGGTCVQSEHGTMRGWRIHPDELPRFQAKVVGNRVVVAPDGTLIEVVHRPAERHHEESWTPRWAHLEALITWDWHYHHNPTDAEVLADYAAWKAARS